MNKTYKIRIVFSMWVLVLSLVAFLASYWMTRMYYEEEEKYLEEDYKVEMADESVETASTPLFLLVEVNGYVVVEYFNGGKVFDETGISVSDLPEQLQEQIKGGIPINNQQQLYNFLENYSS